MNKENTITIRQRIGRDVLGVIEACVLPTKVVHRGNGLGKARGLRKTEGRDVFFMTTHPSETDEPREYLIPWNTNEFSQNRIIVPNAWDQNTAVVKMLGNLTGIDLYPIVTRRTTERDTTGKLKVGTGNRQYFRAIIERTGHQEDPSMIFLAPDAGIKPTLQTPNTKAAELLLTSGGKHAVVVFIGVEINGVKDYVNKSGKNLGKTYTIHVGNAYTNEELLEHLKEYRLTHNLPEPRKKRPYANLDRWIYETQFPSLVPKEYLTKWFIQIIPNLFFLFLVCQYGLKI